MEIKPCPSLKEARKLSFGVLDRMMDINPRFPIIIKGLHPIFIEH